MIEHPMVNNGVFLRLKEYGILPKGSLIGFVPGLYFLNGEIDFDEEIIMRPIPSPFLINKEII